MIKNIIKILVLSVSSVLIFFVVESLILIIALTIRFPSVTKNQMAKKYEQYKEEMTKTANFMAELEYEYAEIAEEDKPYEQISVYEKK